MSTPNTPSSSPLPEPAANGTTASMYTLSHPKVTSSTSRTNTCIHTPLMYVEVAAIVPPKHQAYIRSAGSKGADAYEEVIERGKAMLHIEYSNCGDAVPHHAPVKPGPITHPFSKIHIDASNEDTTTLLLVVHDAYLLNSLMLYELIVKPIQRMRYVGGPEVTTICALPGSYGWDMALPWVVGYKGVTHFELRGFKSLQTVSHYFLYGSSLPSIDLSPFSSVTKIGGYFMADSNELASIDLTPLKNIEEIGINFLSGCSSLTSVDLTPLVNLIVVGDHFMEDCTSIAKVVVGPLKMFPEVTGGYLKTLWV